MNNLKKAVGKAWSDVQTDTLFIVFNVIDEFLTTGEEFVDKAKIAFNNLPKPPVLTAEARKQLDNMAEWNTVMYICIYAVIRPKLPRGALWPVNFLLSLQALVSLVHVIEHAEKLWLETYDAQDGNIARQGWERRSGMGRTTVPQHGDKG